MAGSGDRSAPARAHGGARLARPGHVPGRAGHEAGGAGGAAPSALARAALGAAAAAAAVSPGPGERPGPGRGREGQDWHPRHLPAVPACGVGGSRARVLEPPLLKGSRAAAGLAGHRARYPAAWHPRAGGGLQVPGCAEPPRGHPRGLQAVSGPPFPELVPPAGRARPPEAAGGGVCAEGAGRGAGRPGLRGPRGRAEGQRRPAGARPGQAGGRGRGARPPGRGHRFLGEFPPWGQGTARGGPSRRPSSSRGSRLLPWGLPSGPAGTGSPPTAQRPRFAAQLVLRPAWR